MKHHMFFAWLPLILFIHSFNLIPTHSLVMPRLSPFPENTLVSINPKKFKTFYFKQVLDHFNYNLESYKTFNQRYIINFKYWGGAKSNAPIFVFLGAEAPLEAYPDGVGFLNENSATFKALTVYIEHRYYGKSLPFGSREESFKNASTMGYLNSAQALQDYADILVHIKNTLHAQDSPIVVFGGSYGGMLAAWFRLKYPHLAIGALSSSAPILDVDDIIQPNAFMDIVSKDFKEESENCYQTILKSWSEIKKVASQPNGLYILSQRFKTCNPLIQSIELTSYLEHIYTFSAQYNAPPNYPVTQICNGIDQAAFGNNTLDKIYAGVVALNTSGKCVNTNPAYSPDTDEETKEGWRWQTCTEMVMPFGKGKDSMFQPEPFNLSNYIENCKNEYGVSPRPHWISTFYGGQNIKLVLQKFGSNIIFSNGLKDPFSSGGVVNDLSESLVAVYTINGSHGLDLQSSRPGDPDWLTEQREKEILIIKGWIAAYYTDLGVPDGQGWIHKGAAMDCGPSTLHTIFFVLYILMFMMLNI